MKSMFSSNIEDFDLYKFNKILLVLFLGSLIVVPFDNLPYFSNVLGELSVRGPVYFYIPMMLTILIYFIYKKKVYLNITVDKVVLIIFMFWMFISSALNIKTIVNNNFKGRNGLEKLLLQIMVVGFMVAIMYCVELVVSVNKIKLETIRKYILISFILVSMYSFLEVLQIYNIVDVSGGLKGISNFIHTYNRGLLYGDRLRSLTGEASFFGMYAAFAYPWVISYIFTEKSKKKKIIFAFVAFYFLFFIYLTKSRTAYVIIYGEIALVTIGIMLFNKNNKNKIMAVVIAICCFISISAFGKFNAYMINNNLNSSENMEPDDGYNFEMSLSGLAGSLTSKTNYSNIARLGLQKSALKMGNDYPILGVGLGQFGFYADNYLGDDTRVSPEIQTWTDPNKHEAWPPAFALFPRIVAEQGYVGLVMWLIFILILSLKTLKVIILKKENLLEIFMLVSFCGVVISFLNVDTFGLPQFWILVGIIMAYTNRKIIEQ